MSLAGALPTFVGTRPARSNTTSSSFRASSRHSGLDPEPLSSEYPCLQNDAFLPTDCQNHALNILSIRLITYNFHKVDYTSFPDKTPSGITNSISSNVIMEFNICSQDHCTFFRKSNSHIFAVIIVIRIYRQMSIIIYHVMQFERFYISIHHFRPFCRRSRHRYPIALIMLQKKRNINIPISSQFLRTAHTDLFATFYNSTYLTGQFRIFRKSLQFSQDIL